MNNFFSVRFRCLVLGGEKFPSAKEVMAWQNWNDIDNRKRIFNIYGITEMSCWALIHEVTKDDLECGKIPLGIPIDDQTSLAFYPHVNDNDDDNESKRVIEELILTTSSRVNFFDNNDWDSKLGSSGVFAYITNDLIEKIDEKVYWYGRKDDLIKRFGERVDLSRIESFASEIISPTSCIFIKKRIVLFYQSTKSHIESLLRNHLRLKLKSSEIPDVVKRIDFLPTCNHGKVSKNKLKELYKDILKEESVKSTAEDIFLEAINQIFNLKLENPTERMSSTSNNDEPDGKRMRTNIDSTFNQIGGDSFHALRIAMKIEDKMEVNSNGLLPKLLDNRHSIKDIFSYLKDLKLKPKNTAARKFLMQQNEKTLISFKTVRKYDLKKCVDSSPALINVNDISYIVVGSHFGKVIVIETDKFLVISEIELNDRVECEASQYKKCFLIGCYNGSLYSIDFLNSEKNGTIKWKFDSGGMIKSKPLVIDDEFILFGNYAEENLRCIHADTTNSSMKIKWIRQLGKSGIAANLLRIDKKSFLACTLDGTCERLDIFDGTSIWSKKFDFPIFSSPQKINNTNKILLAEVMRKIHCIDTDGNSIWNFETQGHIFSSFLFNQINDHSETKIIFGSHDKKLRCLNFDNKQASKVSLEWEIELQSQIYGTPKMFSIDNSNDGVNNKEFIVSCTTNGYVNVINFSTGTLENSIKLPNEIYSSPLIYKNIISVGCRDNLLYCFKVE